MTAEAAAIVDSRNVFHQCGDAIGVRALPTVGGVQRVLALYGYEVKAVHVGLALARPTDQDELSRQHNFNERYRDDVLAAGGEVMLGELHKKKSTGIVEEKMVDVACSVRIARYVDEITYGRTSINSIVVLSKDSDLTPAVDYAVEMKVAVAVAAMDVVHHRGHPFVLLGPRAYAELGEVADMSTGHELRELLALALHDGNPIIWTVRNTREGPKLEAKCGLTGVPANGVVLPRAGQKVTLRPIDVTWNERINGAFPMLVCDSSLPAKPTWIKATVKGRPAPMTVEFKREDGATKRGHFPLGGVVPGETVIIQAASNRVLGRLPATFSRPFDPDEPHVLRVVSSLPKGGAIVADTVGVRGLLNTDQKLLPGQRVPGLQVDLKPKGPVWAAVGTPLPLEVA